MVPILLVATIVHDGTVRDVIVDREIEVSVGDQVEIRVPRQDADSTYNLDGLPENATAHAGPEGIDVRWVPTERDVGSHKLRVDVRAADGERTPPKTVRVIVDERGHLLFVPGVTVAFYAPNDISRYGAFVGGGVDLAIYTFTAQGNMYVPSHGRFYIDALVLGSAVANIDPLFSAALGFDLTLEQSPHRRFLLPFVGAQVGIAFQKETGTFGWAMPLAGLYVWASRYLRFAVLGGYLLSTTDDQSVRGPLVSATVNLSSW
jgi:hypothetical protein